MALPNLTNLPPEVYDGIQSFLEPQDMVRLSRTSKNHHAGMDEYQLVTKLAKNNINLLKEKFFNELKATKPDVDFLKYLLKHPNLDKHLIIVRGLLDAFKSKNERAIQAIWNLCQGQISLVVFTNEIAHKSNEKWMGYMDQLKNHGFWLHNPNNGLNLLHILAHQDAWYGKFRDEDVIRRMQWAIDHGVDLNQLWNPSGMHKKPMPLSTPLDVAKQHASLKVERWLKKQGARKFKP